MDAHVTPPAANAIAPGQMVAIMGTSTCHVMSATGLAEVPGMCGAVHGGIVAGLWGYEAGQSGVGDIFAWFAEHAVPAGLRRRRPSGGASRCSPCCRRRRPRSPRAAHGLIALDWLSGNRSVLVDHFLSGAIVGLDPGHPRPGHLPGAGRGDGVRDPGHHRRVRRPPAWRVTELVIAGGLLKDPFVMQVYADVLRRPLSLIASEQGPALGSAIHAAVAAGAYPDVPAAAAAMGGKREAVYTPDAASADVYDELYAEYVRLHDYFGRGANEVMHRLRAIRDRALARATPVPADPRVRPAGHEHRFRARPRPCARPASRSPPCTPSWSRPAWSPGPPVTSPPGSPAPT